MSQRERTLRVLASPGFANREVDPFSYMLNQALVAQGVHVAPLTRRRVLTERWDIVHVHWPEFALSRRSRFHLVKGALSFLFTLQLARWRGARLVWTVHNLHPHERNFPSARVANFYWKVFQRQVDCFVSMTRSGVPAIHGAYPALRRRCHAVISRGLFEEEYPHDLERDDARQRLGIAESSTVFCFLGMIRPYKNVPELIRAFQDAALPDSYLLVAGKALDDAILREVAEAAAGDERVILRTGFVPAAEVQVYLTSADVVVLPYTEILNSGAVLLALAFERPVLVPDLPTFRELRDEVGGGWVQTYRGPLSPEALRESLDKFPPTEPARLGVFNWDRNATQTVDLYKSCVGTSRSRAGRG